MMTLKRHLGLLALILALSVVAAACANDDGG